jgi:hypothetical protein
MPRKRTYAASPRFRKGLPGYATGRVVYAAGQLVDDGRRRAPHCEARLRSCASQLVESPWKSARAGTPYRQRLQPQPMHTGPPKRGQSSRHVCIFQSGVAGKGGVGGCGGGRGGLCPTTRMSPEAALSILRTCVRHRACGRAHHDATMRDRLIDRDVTNRATSTWHSVRAVRPVPRLWR